MPGIQIPDKLQFIHLYQWLFFVPLQLPLHPDISLPHPLLQHVRSNSSKNPLSPNTHASDGISDHNICAKLTDQIHNLPLSFFLEMVIGKMGYAHRVEEVGAEESGPVEGQGDIKESQECQLLAQKQGAARVPLQPVAREVEIVQEGLEGPVGVRLRHLCEDEAQTF